VPPPVDAQSGNGEGNQQQQNPQQTEREPDGDSPNHDLFNLFHAPLHQFASAACAPWSVTPPKLDATDVPRVERWESPLNGQFL